MIFNKLFSRPQDDNQKSYGSVANYFHCYTEMSGINNDLYLQHNLEEFLNSFLLSPALNRVINSITNKAISIEPVLKDINKDEFIYNHPFLDLLNNPNPFDSQRLFTKTFYAHQLLTGNAYINVVGRLGDLKGNKEPIELQVLNPSCITSESNFDNGYARTYRYNSSGRSLAYDYDIATKKYMTNNGNELLHQRDFNPNFGVNCLYGSSRVQAIILEIQQYLQASIHNYSLLKNQGRPSGMVTADDDSLSQLQPDQQELIKDQIKEIKGASNAGKIALLPFKLKWQSLSENIKDMDFKSLKEMTEKAVYKAFDYPLTFIDEKSSTMNNKNIARLDLYDNAILPLVKWRDEFLTNKILKTRYLDGKNLILTYDEFTIEALRERKLQDAERKASLNVFSANEIRRELGEESFAGGDAIYQPINLVPMGQDQFTVDNREAPAKNFEREYYIKQMTKKGYKLEEIEKDLDNLYD